MPVYLTNESQLAGERESLRGRLEELRADLARLSADEVEKAVVLERMRELVSAGAANLDDLADASAGLDYAGMQRRRLVEALAHAEARLRSIDVEFRLTRNQSPDEGMETIA